MAGVHVSDELDSTANTPIHRPRIRPDWTTALQPERWDGSLKIR